MQVWEALTDVDRRLARTPLDRALEKIGDQEPLTAADHAAVQRGVDALSFSPEELAAMNEDAGVDPDAELAYLRGEGPDPWHV